MKKAISTLLAAAALSLSLASTAMAGVDPATNRTPVTVYATTDAVRNANAFKHLLEQYRGYSPEINVYHSTVNDYGEYYEVPHGKLTAFLPLESSVADQIHMGNRLTLEGITYTITGIANGMVFLDRFHGTSPDAYLQRDSDGRYYLYDVDSDVPHVTTLYSGPLYFAKDTVVHSTSGRQVDPDGYFGHAYDNIRNWQNWDTYGMYSWNRDYTGTFGFDICGTPIRTDENGCILEYRENFHP